MVPLACAGSPAQELAAPPASEGVLGEAVLGWGLCGRGCWGLWSW